MDSKPFFSIPEVAKMCGVSRSTVWGWVKSGYINALVTPGGHHRIPSTEIEKIMSESLATSPSRNSSKTILIVDDDPQIVKLIAAWLSEAGFIIETAKNGFEAGIKLFTLRPNLVILDLFMPELDGFDVCRTIKNNCELSVIKIVALTGFDNPENKKLIMSIGADIYMSKPVDFDELHEKIDILLAEDQ